MAIQTIGAGGAGMSVVEKTCFVVACDRCGDPYEEGDGPPHFATSESAAAYLRNVCWDTSWNSDGSAWFCEDCADVMGWVCDDCLGWFPNTVMRYTSLGRTACDECLTQATEVRE